MTDEFDRIAGEAWEQAKTPLERMYDVWVGEGNWEPAPPQITYRIYDQAGQPIACHLCGSTDSWVLEGREDAGVTPAFVCDHGTESGVIRKVSSVPANRVGRVEETSRPPE
jgi:hypothetical protein